MQRASARTLLFLFIVLLCPLHPPRAWAAAPEPAAAAEQQPATPAQGELPGATTEQKTGLIELYTWTNTLPKELIDLKQQLAKNEILAMDDLRLLTLEDEIGELRWDVTKYRASATAQYLDIDSYQARLRRLESRLARLQAPVNQTVEHLSRSRKDWLNKQEVLHAFSKEETLSLALSAEQQQQLEQSIQSAVEMIDSDLKAALISGKRLGDIQVSLYALASELSKVEEEFRKASVRKTSPSMLSPEFYRRINSRLAHSVIEDIRVFAQKQLELAGQHLRLIAVVLFLLLILTLAVRWTRTLVDQESRWAPFAALPCATAMFLMTSLYSFTSMFPIPTALPPDWETMLHMITILAVIRLSSTIITDRWKRQLLSRLALFMVINIFLITINLPDILILLFVFYASIVALAFYLLQLTTIKKKDKPEQLVRLSWGIIPLLILLSGMLGYDQIAVLSFATLLASVVTCLVTWMLCLLNLGVLSLLLTLSPFNLMRDNQAVIVQSLRPIMIWLHYMLAAAVLAVIWDIFPTIDAAFRHLFLLGLDIGDFRLSIGFVLAIFFVYYGANLLSRAIQTILLREVLPRYSAEKGVQLSITRLAHYAVLVIGFIILLRILGFELNQLTLLGGALGVGIGFGLQAIVNNFASGLILLFERPVKVGDTIQVGQELGEVKELGLRATIIQTFDNAEIVVPNSDLVTGQVTNWTLADRKVRVKVPVGVAYGSDVGKVLEILMSCARNNPMVMNTPRPAALFLGFGASSLDFELRVWIPEFLDKLQALSELNTDIESEFSLQGIEIPFPQTDLHLRTVDAAAAAALHGQGRQAGPPRDPSGTVEDQADLLSAEAG